MKDKPSFYDQFISLMNRMQGGAWQVSEDHGFHEARKNPLFVPTALALIASEVSEALAEHRKGADDKLGPEMADIALRLLDLAEHLKINLGEEIVKKHRFNMLRPFKHGNKRY